MERTYTISTTSTIAYFVLKITRKLVEVFFNPVCKTSTGNTYLHHYNWGYPLVEILQP
jgi:hypothetical protein